MATGTVYPGSLDSFVDKIAGDSVSPAEWNVHSSAIEQIEARINQILTGKSGGQTLTGGTASAENLTLSSTSHATKGKIQFGASAAIDEANKFLGVGLVGPTHPLHVLSALATSAAGNGYRLASSQGTPRIMEITFGGADTLAMGAVSNHTLDIMQNGAARIRIAGTTGVGIGLTAPTPDTRLHLYDNPAITMDESTVTPANPASGTQMRVYMKADKFVIQYNEAAVIRYKFLDLTGTGTTWVHTTTPP